MSESQDETDILRKEESLSSDAESIKSVNPPFFDSFDLDGVVKKVAEAENIIVMVGAGLSTAAGIPDFRTPGSGLYDNLQKYNLPSPETIFSLKYFARSPEAFYSLAKEMWPGNYEPTYSHYFLTLLERKDKLRRCYSQNIDSLETRAGLSREKLIACHGNFDEAHGIETGVAIDIEEAKRAILDGNWEDLRDKYGELVKPKIVFFGEDLPEKFATSRIGDFKDCDLLLVIGTSLVVSPFNSLILLGDRKRMARVLINRECAGMALPETKEESEHIKSPEQIFGHGGFMFNNVSQNFRDAGLLGDADDIIKEMVIKLGWEDDMNAIIEEFTENV